MRIRHLHVSNIRFNGSNWVQSKLSKCLHTHIYEMAVHCSYSKVCDFIFIHDRHSK
jgi:hypothetical protein